MTDLLEVTTEFTVELGEPVGDVQLFAWKNRERNEIVKGMGQEREREREDVRVALKTIKKKVECRMNRALERGEIRHRREDKKHGDSSIEMHIW